jgi:radical SAM protein
LLLLADVTVHPAARDLARSPLVAVWEVTRACDLAWLHCRACAVPGRDPRELTTAEAFDLLDQLRELAPGVVVLTGGDPLKRPDLEAIVAAAAGRGLTVAIAPSVTPLLTAEAIERLGRGGASRIALSLDGPEPAVHDAIRGTLGSFAATRDAIAAVAAAGLALQINTSISPATVAGLPALGALVAAVRPALWSVFFVVPVGRAALGPQLDAATCEAIFNQLYEWSEDTGIAVKTTAAPAFRRVVLQREALRRRARRGRPSRLAARVAAVNDGKGFVFVSHTGDVFPSGFLPLSAGNVRRDSLAALYRQRPLFRDLRADWRIEGKCGICAFRTVCGGSRARAYATTGNLFAEDPACAYEPRRPA